MENQPIDINILDQESIDNAIQKIEEYKNSLETKNTKFKKRLIDEIANRAQILFDTAIVDDVSNKTTGPVPAKVTVVKDGEHGLVIAQGEDAVWVEFGAGVYHASVGIGESPNPWSMENGLGFSIGTFGKNGQRETWGFKKNGQLHLTHGTYPLMPLYKSTMRVLQDISDIAAEEFKNND